MAEFWIVYGIGYVVSVVVLTGWEFADMWGEYSHVSTYRETLGFCLAHSLFGCVFWPVILPLMYFITGFAEHGWRVRVPQAPSQDALSR
jgi:hypothetical protein